MLRGAYSLLAFLLLATATMRAGDDDNTLREPTLNLSVTGTSAVMRESAADIARLSQNLLDALLRNHDARPPGANLLVLADGGEPDPARTDPTVVLRRNMTPEILVHTLCRAVIQRAMTPMLPRGEFDVPSTHEWLAAAMTRRILAKLRGDTTSLGLLLPASAADGRIPDLGNLADHPVPPEAYLAYLLYARYADLLLSLIERADTGKDGCLRRILEFQAAGRAPSQAVRLALGDRPENGQSLPAWEAQETVRLIRRHHRPRSSQEIRERLNEITSVTLAAPGRTGVVGWGRVPFEQASETAGTAELAPQAVANRLRQLNELWRGAPLLLQPSLHRFSAGLQAAAAARDPRPLQQDWKLARAQFDEAAARQDRLEDFLEGLEKETGRSPALQAEVLLPLAAAGVERRRALFPELALWLDSLDR